ncbi:potassium channel family protein [Georgenia satyanarayanai]|uniref:potassium channel family protein n=1 Tax=Georgenia satyanarayanai TaxID=860221 RepID=UPI001D033377|nr:potassium channel family protein [Georgenia satyanarayanai]
MTGQPRARSAYRRRRRALAALRPVLTAVLLVVVFYLWPFERPSGATLVSLVLGLAALLVLLTWQVRAVARSPEPRLRAVEALATSISLFVVLFAGFYAGLSEYDPDAFTVSLTRTDALYFTVTTMATVGFGDITALTEPARVAVTVQMVAGLVLLGAG